MTIQHFANTEFKKKPKLTLANYSSREQLRIFCMTESLDITLRFLRNTGFGDCISQFICIFSFVCTQFIYITQTENKKNNIDIYLPLFHIFYWKIIQFIKISNFRLLYSLLLQISVIRIFFESSLFFFRVYCIIYYLKFSTFYSVIRLVWLFTNNHRSYL